MGGGEVVEWCFGGGWVGEETVGGYGVYHLTQVDRCDNVSW